MLPTKKEMLGAFHYAMEKRGLTTSTRRAYAHWVDRFLTYLGAVRPEEVGQEAIQRYLTFEGKRGLSVASRRLAITAIRLFFHEVYAITTPSPDALGFHKPKAQRGIALSKEEVDAILARMHGGHGLAARLIVRCGLRASECCRLRIGDVDAPRGRLLVEGAAPGDTRILEIPRDLMQPVREQKDRVKALWIQDWQDGWANVMTTAKTPATAWLFPAKNRRWIRGGFARKEIRHHLNPNSVHKAVRMAMDRAGIERARPCSALRATFAAQCLARGECAREVARVMGLRRTDSLALTNSA